ncbi:MAG: phosphoribosylformylglycinamidine synthase subunit PurQ [Actinobacteria bacterium]|nr:phosphoribosylformylglycinamidine synthase subunit PurQ [Actinomycetota bacterium]
MRFGVVVFPGSCDDVDARLAARRVGEDVALWHADRDLQGVDAVIIPGGFSYGDYLRAGAIARFSPIMGEVIAFAQAGGLVMGICNGFQVLCEAGLLPGALLPNTGLRFLCRQVELEVVNPATPFTRACAPGARLSIPVKHTTGRYYAPPDTLVELETGGQVVLRYALDQNPNGSIANIAGVTNARGNVFGLMPHPEHAVDPLTGSTDGLGLFASIRDTLAARAPAGVGRP